MNDIASVLILFSLISLLIMGSAVMLGYFYGIPSGNVAVVYIHDEIFPISNFFEGVQTSDSIISMLESAERNPNVEAVVLSINSPGGTVVSSKEVAAKVNNLTKPVVAWIRDLGASGAYLIACSADYIISDELSMVGGVGSIISYLEWSETLSEYGVEYVSITSGEYKDMGSLYRNLTSDEKEILESWVNESSTYFINYVVEKRNLTSSDIISTGRVFTGTEAVSIGLIDELGGKTEVMNYLNSVGIEELVFEDYKSTSLFSELSGLTGFRSTLSVPTYD